ncbi:hypothetical protein HHK36_018012 [Tetracentron sinense]|uniref:Uncharacterized protein n=1 Tax=Tetracentron sinense TaxID=13715 RepID=A0A834YXS8_TETSI|nr:hypothetical protein HHK36_018012 [Tetracentron sinense]
MIIVKPSKKLSLAFRLANGWRDRRRGYWCRRQRGVGDSVGARVGIVGNGGVSSSWRETGELDKFVFAESEREKGGLLWFSSLESEGERRGRPKSPLLSLSFHLYEQGPKMTLISNAETSIDSRSKKEFCLLQTMIGSQNS